MIRIHLLTLSTLFSHGVKGQVYIMGKVIDRFDNKVTLFEPIDGHFNNIIEDSSFSVPLDSNRCFLRKVDIEKPMQLVIRVGSLNCLVTAFPSDTIGVDLNLDAWDSTNGDLTASVKFYGNNKDGNLCFNQYDFPGAGAAMDFFQDLKKAGFFGGPRKIELFDSVLKRQTWRYDQLLRDGKITNGFHAFVTKALDQFLLSTSIEAAIDTKELTYDEKMDYMGKMYSFYAVKDDDPVNYNNVYSYAVASFRYMYVHMLKNHLFDSHFPNAVLAINHRNYILNGDVSEWGDAPKSFREDAWAIGLIMLKRDFAGSYGQKDAEAYLAEFPYSPFRKYLVPPFYGLRPWAKSDSAKVTFIRPQKDDNLDTVIRKYFKGQNVLIDLWASWCVPCKLEFQYSPDVDKFCSLNNIQRLYISLDRMEQTDAMIKDIYAYELAGAHIRTTYKLEQDIITRVFDNKEDSLAIPRYILVNSRGEIVDNDLVRPSHGKIFYKAILNELFNSR